MHKRIVIVGGGISGLGLLYLLRKYTKHKVTLLELQEDLGGHANAVKIGNDLVDTGFMVFNKKTYPNIIRLFTDLGVSFHETDMSFSCVDQKNNFSFSSQLATSSAWYMIRHWKVLRGILKLHKQVRTDVRNNKVEPGESIQEYANRVGLDDTILTGYFLPMIAAVWSQMDGVDVRAMPAQEIFNFLDNHQLLESKRPVWYTLKGSSRMYVKRIERLYSDSIHTGARVVGIRGDKVKSVEYIHNDTSMAVIADEVVFACHGDQVQSLLSEYTDHKIDSALGRVEYRDTPTVLHSDPAHMPQERSMWSSWNFMTCPKTGAHYCTYWLNALQNLQTTQDLFITIKPPCQVNPELVFDTFDYAHPVFTVDSSKIQKSVQHIQGHLGYYYTGAWLRHGFHEDGLWSALRVYQIIEGDIPKGYVL